MKAIVQERYGSPSVLELREVDEPVAGKDQVVVRVRAASVHADVWHVMRGQPYVLRIMGAGLQAQGSRSGHGSGRPRRVGRRERDAVPAGR
jgi:NADPH:quinone reductase-like Zn-dependent oxidoreductase